MSRKEIKISRKKLVEMLGSEDVLGLCVRTSYCGNDDCGGTTEIVDYEDNIFINDLGDSILRGKCKKCGAEVARYIETGDGGRSYI